MNCTEFQRSLMKTEKDLNEAILKITMKIQDEFPELTKYLKEMPVKFSSASANGVSVASLQEYHDSLTALMKNYSEEHRRIQE